MVRPGAVVILVHSPLLLTRALVEKANSHDDNLRHHIVISRAVVRGLLHESLLQNNCQLCQSFTAVSALWSKQKCRKQKADVTFDTLSLGRYSCIRAHIYARNAVGALLL